MKGKVLLKRQYEVVKRQLKSDFRSPKDEVFLGFLVYKKLFIKLIE
jgi:hypothetical protein